MATIQAKILKQKIEAKIKILKKEIQEVIQETKDTSEDFKEMSTDEVEAFVIEAFTLLYDDIDEVFKFPKMVDLAAKELLISEGVAAIFDKFID